LYYQNPTFGFFFLQLTSDRLFENIKRLELEVAQLRAQLAAPSRGSQAAPGGRVEALWYSCSPQSSRWCSISGPPARHHVPNHAAGPRRRRQSQDRESTRPHPL